MYNSMYCHDPPSQHCGGQAKQKISTKHKGSLMGVLKLAYELLPSNDRKVTEFDEMLSE